MKTVKLPQQKSHLQPTAARVTTLTIYLNNRACFSYVIRRNQPWINFGLFLTSGLDSDKLVFTYNNESDKPRLRTLECQIIFEFVSNRLMFISPVYLSFQIFFLLTCTEIGDLNINIPISEFQ